MIRTRLVPAVVKICIRLTILTLPLSATSQITELSNRATNRQIGIVGAMHTNFYVSTETGERVESLFKNADAIFFETVDGLISPRRQAAYQRSSNRFVKTSALRGDSATCSHLVSFSFPTEVRDILKDAPAIFNAFALEKASGAKYFARKTAGTDFNIYDAELVKMARRIGRPIHEAETTEDVIDFATSFTLAEVDETISAICHALQHKDAKNSVAALAAEARAQFRRGDWDANFIKAHEIWVNTLQMPEYTFSRLIAGRTKRMTTRIERTSFQRAVVVIGSAHIGGPEGIIELLKKNGYELTH